MWVMKALSAFVTAAEPGPYLMPKWRILKSKGVMSNDLMSYHLKQIRDYDSDDFGAADTEKIESENRLIFRLLELLDIITPFSESSQQDFYVPSLLTTAFLLSPTDWELLSLTDSKPSRKDCPAPLIVFPTRLKFVPEFLYFRLITRFLNVYSNKPRLSRHQCIFLVQDIYSPVEGRSRN